MARTPNVWFMSLGRRQILFAGTQKAAAEACGMPVSTFAAYASVTGNDDDIAMAQALPGVLFVKSLRGNAGPGPRPEWRQAKGKLDNGD